MQQKRHQGPPDWVAWPRVSDVKTPNDPRPDDITDDVSKMHPKIQKGTIKPMKIQLKV